jgi:exodeoxyribonuclease VIII
MKPSFIFDQSEPEYRAATPVLSQSIIKNILNKSPAHALTAIQSPVDSAAMRLGRAAHCLTLEGSTVFNQHYIVAPECDRRTKEGKTDYADFLAKLGNKEVITLDELATVTAMDEALKQNNLTKHLFVNGCPEVSAFGQVDGTPIKGRFDYYHPNEQIIIDLKTCLDASPEAAKKYVINYGLHIQQYVYSEIHRSITGSAPTDFIFVLVEKSAPYAVAVFRLDKEAIAAAKLEVQRGLEIYRQCIKTNTWPAYPEAVQSIGLPAWYLKQVEVTA